MNAVRMSAAALDRLRAHTSERDRQILALLDERRFLTTRQIARHYFTRTGSGNVAIRATTRVLGRLRELGLIERLARQVGGVHAGSAAFVWSVTSTGERLVHPDASSYRRTRHLPSLDLLAHTLAIAEVELLLLDLARAHRIDLIGTEFESTSWRRYVGPDGAPQTLKPDLLAVTANADFEDHWFIEVDRGREGLGVLVRKCAQYAAYARTGREQATRGVFPLILWLLPTQARADHLAREVALDARLDGSLFRFATPASLRALLTDSSAENGATTDEDVASLAALLAGGVHDQPRPLTTKGGTQ